MKKLIDSYECLETHLNSFLIFNLDFKFASIKELITSLPCIQSHFQCQDMIHLSWHSCLSLLPVFTFQETQSLYWRTFMVAFHMKFTNLSLVLLQMMGLEGDFLKLAFSCFKLWSLRCFKLDQAIYQFTEHKKWSRFSPTIPY